MQSNRQTEAHQQVNIGVNAVIGDQVSFGEGVVIGNNVVIYEGTIIGDHVVIQDNVVIGKQPAKAKNSILHEPARMQPAIIGSGCTVGTSAIIYAGACLAADVFIADLATVRERVQIGERTIIGRGVAIENDCTVGSCCKLETNSYITAYSTVGDSVFVAPGVITSNDNYMGRTKERFAHMQGITLKKGARIGANATTLPGITVEEDGAVAAGSVVTRDVEARELVMGVPARGFRSVPVEQLLDNQ